MLDMYEQTFLMQETTIRCVADMEIYAGSGTSGAMPAYHGPSLYTIWLYTIHGWLMSIAWGALAPAAILVAYKFKDLPSAGLWFQIHRAMMVRVSTSEVMRSTSGHDLMYHVKAVGSHSWGVRI